MNATARDLLRRMSRRGSALLHMFIPVSFLLMTCCMAQVEAQTRTQTDRPAPAATATADVQVQAPALTGQPSAAAAATEAALLLAQKSSKFAPQPSKKESPKTPSKSPGAAAAEDEEEEDEEDTEDAEPAKTPAATKGGKATGKGPDVAKEEEEDEENEEDEEKTPGSPTVGGALPKNKIKSDFDQNVLATLTSVVVRGAVLTAEVSLTFQGGKDQKESEHLHTSLDGRYSHVLDYESGTTYAIKKIDGFSGGRLKPGQETKTVRATFDAPPKTSKTVGITLYGIGTFDDVKLR